jgi:hypothetical protein
MYIHFMYFLKKTIVLYRPDDDPVGGSKHVAWDTLLNILNFVNCVVFDWSSYPVNTYTTEWLNLKHSYQR